MNAGNKSHCEEPLVRFSVTNTHESEGRHTEAWCGGAQGVVTTSLPMLFMKECKLNVVIFFIVILLVM